MPSRVKQFGNDTCLRIDSRQVCAFVQIAINAGEGQVVEADPHHHGSWKRYVRREAQLAASRPGGGGNIAR